MNAAAWVQLGIIFCSGVSILLMTRRQPWHRWAYPIGLAGQPLWAWSTWQSAQWGMFVLVAIYTVVWAQGLWEHWLADWCWQLRRRCHVSFRRW